MVNEKIHKIKSLVDLSMDSSYEQILEYLYRIDDLLFDILMIEE